MFFNKLILTCKKFEIIMFCEYFQKKKYFRRIVIDIKKFWSTKCIKCIKIKNNTFICIIIYLHIKGNWESQNLP